MDCQIRRERLADIPGIAKVNSEAFGREDEARIVTALRNAGMLTYSLVALVDGLIVGHLALSPVTIQSPNGSTPVLGLAPMAVLPRLQRLGIGSRLVRHGIEAAREGGHRAMVVLGHPAYYPRFGFEPASRYDIVYEFPVRPEAFMVLELVPESLSSLAGTAHYAPPIYS